MQNERLIAARSAAELDAARGVSQLLEAQLTELEDAATEQANELEELARALRAGEEALVAAREEHQRDVEAQNRERLALTALLQTAQEQLAQLRSDCAGADHRAEEARIESARLAAELQSARELARGADAQIQRLERELASATDRLQTMGQVAEVARGRSHQLDVELARTTARLEVSENLLKQLATAPSTSQRTHRRRRGGTAPEAGS